MTAKWSVIFRAHLALELPLSIVYCLAIGKKGMDIASAVKTDVFSFSSGPLPPKAPTLRRNHLFVCVGNTEGNQSLLGRGRGWPVRIRDGQARPFVALCSPTLWIYHTTASVFQMGLGGGCALVCVTLSQVIITLRVSHPVKEGCVLCRCGQEPCGNRCARGEGGASCPLPLRTECLKMNRQNIVGATLSSHRGFGCTGTGRWNCFPTPHRSRVLAWPSRC